MEEQKSSAGLIAAVIVLVVFIICLLGYIGYDKLVVKTGNNEPEQTETKELKESDVSEFLKRIDSMNSAICTNYPFTDINTIPTQKILSIGLGEVFGTYSISSDYVENHIKYILGSNVIIKHEDYLCKVDNIPFYKYNNGYYSFNQEHPGHGGGGGYLVTTFFKDASIKGNTVTINTNLIYEVSSDISGPTTSYYDGASTNAKKILDDIERTSLKSEYEKIKDTLPITTFTFTRSELGGFDLTSVTIK